MVDLFNELKDLTEGVQMLGSKWNFVCGENVESAAIF